MGDAELRGGNIAAARDAFVAAAGHARRLGRADLLAQAAIGLGSGVDGFEVRLFDHAQIDLLDEALARLNPEPSELRAWVTARLSVALTFAESSSRRLQLADEAVVMARSIGADKALAYALAACGDAIAGPDHIDDRHDAAEDIIALARTAQDRGMELLGARALLIALLERGDIARFDAELVRYALAADAIRQPLYQLTGLQDLSPLGAATAHLGRAAQLHWCGRTTQLSARRRVATATAPVLGLGVGPVKNPRH